MDSIPVADEVVELNSDFSPLSPRAPVANPNALPNIEVNDKHVINTVLKEAVARFPTTCDMLVHMGGTIWIKSAKGALKIKDMFEVKTGSPLERPVSSDDIGLFVLRDVLGAKDQAQITSLWERVSRELKEKGSFSETMRLGWGAKARVMLFKQAKGRMALNVRISRSTPPSLEQMGLPLQVLNRIRTAQRGLILLTGPMSSGKTSTAQAILNQRNITRSGHIITIEDPIETDLKSGKCLITTKEVGVDTKTFYTGLVDALRQTADVLFIGELRDADTIRTAIAAAASGILVVATTHGDTCTGTLNKMMTLLGSEAPGYWKLLAQNLVCVVRQAMVPGINGDAWHMASDALMPTEGGQLLEHISNGEISKVEQLMNGPTPPQPSGQGASRSQPEWLSMNERLRELIRDNKVALATARQLTSAPKGLVG